MIWLKVAAALIFLTFVTGVGLIIWAFAEYVKQERRHERDGDY